MGILSASVPLDNPAPSALIRELQIEVDLCAGCVVRAGMATTAWRAAPDDKRGGVRDVEACQPGQVSETTVSVITGMPITCM